MPDAQVASGEPKSERMDTPNMTRPISAPHGSQGGPSEWCHVVHGIFLGKGKTVAKNLGTAAAQQTSWGPFYPSGQ